MKVLYFERCRNLRFTQARLGREIESAGLKDVEVIWCRQTRLTIDDIKNKLKDADVVIMTWFAAKKSLWLVTLIQTFSVKLLFYMEDIAIRKHWWQCRSGVGFLGTSLFPWEPDVRQQIQSLTMGRISSQPFWFLGHFGYAGIRSDFSTKKAKILFPSSAFHKWFSSLRVKRQCEIINNPDLKEKVDFLTANNGKVGLDYVKHLGTYMAVLVTVPGTDALMSLIVRKVYETTSTGSLLLMDFGETPSYAKRAMERIGFIDNVHYVDVTHSLTSFSFEDKEKLSAIADAGYELVQSRHLGHHRVEEFKQILKEVIKDVGDKRP